MEKIFCVRLDNLIEVNSYLNDGWTVKSIHPIAQSVSAYGYAGGETFHEDRGSYSGDIYAYIVIERSY